jgi:hypothetical protein
MSYRSVIEQQTIKTSNYFFIGRSLAGTLETVTSMELKGKYFFTCIFAIQGTAGVNEDSDMRAGHVRLVEYPNVVSFGRTLSGIFETGTFEVKQQYRDASDYAIHLKLVKLT